MPDLDSVGSSANDYEELNMDETAQLLDICRGLDTKEITRRFQRVLALNEQEIQTCLLRFMSRGLVNSDNGKWYVMGKGEMILWRYHEIKISLKLERSPDSMIFKIRDRLSPKRRYDMIR